MTKAFVSRFLGYSVLCIGVLNLYAVDLPQDKIETNLPLVLEPNLQFPETPITETSQEATIKLASENILTQDSQIVSDPQKESSGNQENDPQKSVVSETKEEDLLTTTESISPKENNVEDLAKELTTPTEIADPQIEIADYTHPRPPETPVGNEASLSKEQGYKINFKNAPIREYLQFVSKITGINFIYEENNLNFNVTIVSEESVSKQDIMSMLIQVLRIHNLSLLEQDNNYLINANPAVKQLSTVISSDLPVGAKEKAISPALVTRVFRIRNANIDALANIIRSMASSSAQVEISKETRQLIVTDISTNINKIGNLLASIDAPHTPLELEAYTCKFMSAESLISLAEQLVQPFAGGNTLLLVPQPDTNTVFIVSTPYLIEKTLSVVEDLDIPSKEKIKRTGIVERNVTIYKITNQNFEVIEKGLNDIIRELSRSEPKPEALIQALQSAKWVETSNSIMFMADPETANKVNSILKELDSSIINPEAVSKQTLFIYKVKSAEEEQLQKSINQMIDDLEKNNFPDQPLLNALKSAKWIKETNSILFTGSNDAINAISKIMPSFDVSREQSLVALSKISGGEEFLVYSPQHKKGSQVKKELEDLAENLRKSGLTDSGFLYAIENMKWVSSTNSLTFTGDKASLNKVSDLLKKVDIQTVEGNVETLLYRPINKSRAQVDSMLSQLAKDLKPSSNEEREIARAIEDRKWIKHSNSFLFKSTPKTLDFIKEFLKNADQPEKGAEKAQTFTLYPLTKASGEEVLDNLNDFAKKLSKSDNPDEELIKVIDNIEWMKDQNSLLITGSQEKIDKVKSLIAQFDKSGKKVVKPQEAVYFLYELKNASGEVVIENLDEFAKKLSKSDNPDEELIQVIKDIEWMKDNNSLLITGSQEKVDRVKALINQFDVSERLNKGDIKNIGNVYFLYELKKSSGEKVIKNLKQFSKKLSQGNAPDKDLIDAIDAIEWMEETNSLIVSGSPATVDKLKALISQFDSSDRGVEQTKNFLLYDLKNTSGENVMDNLENFSKKLSKSESPDEELIKAIDDVEWMKDTNSILITGSTRVIEKIKALVAQFDVKTEEEMAKKGAKGQEQVFFLYKLKNASGDVVYNSLKDFAKKLAKAETPDTDMIKTIDQIEWIRDNNSLLITGPSSSVEKIKVLIPQFDLAGDMYLYELKNSKGDFVLENLKNFSKKLSKSDMPDRSLIKAIDDLEWMKDTNSLIITGSPTTIEKVKTLIAQFDVLSKDEMAKQKGAEFFLYELKAANGDVVLQNLNDFAKTISKSENPDEKLVKAIEDIKWMKESNSLVLSGSPGTVEKLKALISKFDTLDKTAEEAAKLAAERGESVFYLYELKNSPAESVLKSLNDFSKKLSKTNTSDRELIRVIEQIEVVKENNSLLITGPAKTVEKVKELIPQFDKTGGTFLYELKNTSGKVVIESLNDFAKKMAKSDYPDRALLKAIESIEWMKDSNSLVITGSPATIDKVKDLINRFDIPSAETKVSETSAFFLYELKNVPGDIVLENLHTFSKKLSMSAAPDKDLISTINNIEFMKETNSLLITGSPSAVDKVKAIVAQFDDAKQLAGNVAGKKTDFFIYEPINLTPQEMIIGLKDFAKNLRSSGLVDRDLLQTLDGAEYIKETDSILFTGSPESFDKLKDILTKVDTPQGVKPAEMTFFVYKPQNATPQKLIASLRKAAADLSSLDISDRDLIYTLKNAKLEADTQSIIFSGTPDSLKKLEPILAKFDTKELGPEEKVEMPVIPTKKSSSFKLYQPQFRKGLELIEILKGFSNNLIQAGVEDPDLLDSIKNTRFISQTGDLMVPGTEKSIIQTEELIKRFDTPDPNRINTSNLTSTLEGTNFMVYKLQFHSGEEIQAAIRRIGKQLEEEKSEVNKGILSVIQSLQWIEVTNSFLASGDAESLKKLKFLISNLDIPLRQVFIEVLVIRTTLINAQTFGLQWAARGSYKDKFQGALGNFSNGSSDNTFLSAMNTIPLPSRADKASVPLSEGFDLGIIGDIILHKGKTFLSLGSLVNALQTSADATIVLNPKIVTQDNNSSSIFVGSNIPFVGSIVESTAANTQTVTSLEYRDVGVNLTIKPVLGNEDIITLDIDQSVSVVTENPTISTTQVSGITTSQTSMKTRVHVPNKHFLILSGMVQDTKSRNKVGLPCLGGLPVIGAAFSNTNRDDAKDNLIIFVRPQIINSYDEYRQITQQQQNTFRDATILRENREEFDAAIESVRGFSDKE